MTTEEARKVIIPFGNYQSHQLGKVVDRAIGYFRWLARDADLSGKTLVFREAVAILAEEYKHDIDREIDREEERVRARKKRK